MTGNLTDMTWWEYVRRTAGTDVQTVIAERTGIAQATVSRWKLGRQAVDATSAVTVARAFGRSPVEALVIAGFLKPAEVDAQVTITRHEDPSDDELLALLERRLRRDRQESDEHGREPATTNPAGESPAPRIDIAHARPDRSVTYAPAPNDLDLAAMSGVPAHMPDVTTGEESQDPGSDEPV